MRRSRLRIVSVAILSGLVGRAVTLIVPLIAMTPMLNHLGTSLFGVWLTATALAGMASFLDFGVGNALLTRLSDAYGRGDSTEARRLIGQSYVLLGSISLILIFLIVGISAVALALEQDAGRDDRIVVVAIVVVALFFSFPSLIIHKVLQARQVFVHSQVMLASGPFVALLACLSGINAGVEPVGVVALYAFSNSFVLAIWALAYFRLSPHQRPTFDALKWGQMRQLSTLGGSFFILLIFYVIGMNADNVIISIVADSEAVTEYGVPSKLGGLLMMVVGTATFPLWSIFSEALARNDRAWLRSTTLKMSLGGSALVLCLGGLITFLADPILHVWMGRSFSDQHLVLAGWTVLAAVTAFTAPHNMVLNAAGLARPQILPWIGFVVVSVLAKFALLSVGNTWLAPWISALVYAGAISPFVLRVSRSRISGDEH